MREIIYCPFQKKHLKGKANSFVFAILPNVKEIAASSWLSNWHEGKLLYNCHIKKVSCGFIAIGMLGNQLLMALVPKVRSQTKMFFCCCFFKEANVANKQINGYQQLCRFRTFFYRCCTSFTHFQFLNSEFNIQWQLINKDRWDI